MSMGMMMLPPSVISLPVKILFFVLVDGWNLLIGSLVAFGELRRAISFAQGIHRLLAMRSRKESDR